MKRRQFYKWIRFECAGCNKKVNRRKARIAERMYCSHRCAALKSYYVSKIRKSWRENQKLLMKKVES